MLNRILLAQDAGGQSHLLSNFEVICGGEQWNAYLPFAIAMLVRAGLGFLAVV